MKFNRCLKCMEEMRGTVCEACGTDQQKIFQDPQGLRLETLLHNRYVVGSILGQGGFGITYIGYDLSLDKKVAIKEYFPRNQVSRHSSYSIKLSWDTEAQLKGLQQSGCEHFLKEARRMAKINAIPGIVRVRDTFMENETAYIVMDYVDGITLKEEVERHGTMSYDRCLELLRPMMQSLAKVHEQKLIHRDISPDNIMLRKDGSVCLLDLGAAKDIVVDNRQSTLVAKSGFSPIEQYLTEGEIGPWTDVYALCATIYYCITGRCIPDALSRREGAGISYENVSEKAFPAAARKALEKGLALKGKNRIQTVQELLGQLPREQKDSGKRNEKTVDRKAKVKGSDTNGKKIFAAVLAAVAAFGLIVGAQQLFSREKPEKTTLVEREIQGNSESEGEMTTESTPQTESTAETERAAVTENTAETENAAQTEVSSSAEQMSAGEYLKVNTWVDESGATYTGRRVDGVIEGYGEASYKSGDGYKGWFADGSWSGYGVYTWSSGEVYSGMWKDGDRSGYGVLTYQSGHIHIGMWQEGYRAGLGVEFTEDGEVHSIGEWVLSEADEESGAYTSVLSENTGMERRDTETAIQYGTFNQEGNLEGEGISYDLSQGTVQIGNFENGVLSGQGMIYSTADGAWRAGEIADGKLNGLGVTDYGDGGWSQGEYLEDVMNGYGTCAWENGDVYTGMWKDGDRSGYGVYTWSSGEVYKGMWKDGDQSGYGVLTYQSGNIHIGMWQEGYRAGLGVEFTENGEVHSMGEWVLSEADEGSGAYTSVLTENTGMERRDTETAIQYGTFNQEGNLEGEGISYDLSRGTVQIGNFENGVLSGQGMIYSTAAGAWRAGEITDGKLNGQGVTDYGNGNVYTGMWKAGERSGYGMSTFLSGGVYKGMYGAGERSGYGVFTYQSGHIHIGMWQEGYRAGLGVEFTENGEVHSMGEWVLSESEEGSGTRTSVLTENTDMERRDTETAIQYGTFNQEGNLEGEGISYDLSQGTVQIGNFENGVLSGQGMIYSTADGTWRNGKIVDGKLTGLGTGCFAGGWYQGDFLEDVPEGYGIYYRVSGDVYSGEWKAGIFRDSQTGTDITVGR